MSAPDWWCHACNLPYPCEKHGAAKEKVDGSLANQCDGCRRGLLVRAGIHYDGDHPWIACTAARYPATEPNEGTLVLVHGGCGCDPHFGKITPGCYIHDHREG